MFVVFVCLALIVVTAWLAIRGRDEAVHEAISASTNLTKAVAQQTDTVFSETARILDTLAFEMDRAERDPNTLARLQRVVVNYSAGTEQIHSVMIFDSHGVRMLSSEASPSPFPTVQDREYFVFHRDNPSLSRHIGKPYLSRLYGTWLIPVSRRLDGPSGQFAGVIVSTIKVDYLLQLLSSYEIGPHGVLALILADGTILARRPYAAADIGKSTARSPMFGQVEKNLSGHSEDFSPVDGLERYVSFQHVKNNPMVVILALSKQEVLQQWRSTTYFQSAWILVLCTFVGLLGLVSK